MINNACLSDFELYPRWVVLIFSIQKNSKYVATLKDGKKVNFGNQKYEDFLIHGDEERRKESLARAKKIKNKKKELTWENPESANYRVDSSIVGWCRI